MSHKILYTADLHGNNEFYAKLINIANERNSKAIVIGGDIGPHAHLGLQEAIEFQKKFLNDFLFPLFKNFNGKIYIIMGNDDLAANEPILTKEKNIFYIHLKKEKIGNCNIVGYSFVPQMPFLLKDWEKLDDESSKPITEPAKDILTVPKPSGTIEKDMAFLEKMSNPRKTVYVIHSPPYNTKLDIISSGLHVGSKSVRKFIEKNQPLLTLHGHIHESPEMSGASQDVIGKTICINVGRDYHSKVLRFAEIDLDNLDSIAIHQIR